MRSGSPHGGATGAATQATGRSERAGPWPRRQDGSPLVGWLGSVVARLHPAHRRRGWGFTQSVVTLRLAEIGACEAESWVRCMGMRPRKANRRECLRFGSQAQGIRGATVRGGFGCVPSRFPISEPRALSCHSASL